MFLISLCYLCTVMVIELVPMIQGIAENPEMMKRATMMNNI